MGDGFRGIDPLGLAGLANELDQHGSAIGHHRRAVIGILQSVDHPGLGDASAALQSVEAWTETEADNLRWRADAVATGQRLYPGCGVPELFVTEAHDRALIGAFLPSSFDLEAWAQQWAVTRSRRVGRELADRYRVGEDVSEELVAISSRPHYETAAAAFFNALGPDLAALIPQNVQYSVLQTGTPDEPASIVRRYARAFAAATLSNDLTFTPEELFVRQDPTAQMLNQFEAAHLLTEAGIARPWLVYAVDIILLGEAYIPWVASAQSVASVATGLANNPGIAGEVLAEPGAVEMLLRRSTLLDDDLASAVGDALVAAAVTASDRATAARVAAAMIEAIGGKGVRPSAGVLPGVALVGGTYLDEIAWSLVGWENDSSYRPRFEVERDAARRFLLETIRDTDAYATILAATGVWISRVTSAEEPATLDEYTNSRRIHQEGVEPGRRHRHAARHDHRGGSHHRGRVRRGAGAPTGDAARHYRRGIGNGGTSHWTGCGCDPTHRRPTQGSCRRPA